MTWTFLVYLLIGYLAGSLPVAYLFSLRKGNNIFEQGSGNPGTMNTFVVYGKSAAVVVLVLDVLKGFVPTLLVAQLTGNMDLAWWIGAGCVLGHVSSIFTKFRGGKALATAGGVVLYFHPLSLFLMVGLYILLLLITRYIVFATTLTIFASVGLFWYSDQTTGATLAFLLMLFGIMYRHLPNWERFILGNEPKFTDKISELTLHRFSERGQRLFAISYWVVALLILATVLVLS